MPLYRRLPKRGFNPISKDSVAILNLEKIQSFIDKKNINPSEILNSELLKKLKLVEFINGYQKNRELSNQEKDSFPKALCSAALRFYLSRLHDLHFPKIGEMTHIKDPSIFENILSDRISALDDYKIL